jgi:hypothetical protein
MGDEEKARYKANKLKEVRDFHSQLISDLGINTSDFNMKTQFRDDHGRLVIGIFPSEFKKVKGFFFELVDFDLIPTSSDRKVYRVPPSSSFDDEYELGSKGAYLVPIEELKVINPQSVVLNKQSAFVDDKNVFKITQKAQEASQPKQPSPLKEDAPYSDMTIRDYVAIHTGKQVSNKEWLNELIKQIS